MNYLGYLIKCAVAETVEKLRVERKKCPSNSSLYADDAKCASGYQRTGHRRRRQGSFHTINKDVSNPHPGSPSDGGGTGGNGGAGGAGGGGGGGP